MGSGMARSHVTPDAKWSLIAALTGGPRRPFADALLMAEAITCR